MSLNHLSDELAECEKEAQLRASAARARTGRLRPGKDVLQDSRYPAVDIPSHVRHQRACIRALRAAARAANTAPVRRADRCLFVCGSAARLEYVPGESDIDVLAVIRQRPSLADLGDPKGRCLLNAELASFRSLEDALKASICPRLGMADADGTLEILDRAPVLGRSSYFTESDLVDRAGKSYEASWAAIERAHLLFDAVLLCGDRRLAKKLRDDADGLYGVTADLEWEHFPVTGCCLVNLMGKSGALAKLAKVRGAPANSRVADAEMMKTVFSRIWSSAVNLLTLHALYWKERVAKTPAAHSKEQIRTILRTPPILKVLRELPTLTWQTYDSDGWGAAFLPHCKSDAASARELCQTIHCCLSFHTGGRRPGPPIWFRFLQMQEFCRQVRVGEAWVKPDEEAVVRRFTRELAHVLQLAGRLTSKLSDPTKAVLPENTAYDRFARLVGDAVSMH